MSVKRALAIVVAVAVLAFAAGWRFGTTIAPSIGTTSSAASMPLFQEVLQTLLNDYVTPPKRSTLIEGAINGMTQSLGDPYTGYYTPAEYRQLLDQLNGQFYGIGVEIAQVGDYIVVESVIPSSPAEAAGLQEGDRLTAADGRSLLGVNPTQASALIRGPKGSKVTITVLRGAKRFPVSLTREPVELPTVQSRMLPGKIVYVQLNQVSQNAAALWKSMLSSYEKQNPKGWILDLRNDPGGLVNQAVGIARTLVPSGTIVTFKGRVDNQVYTSHSGMRLKAPMVVLVNGGTASAAEILTGVLQDDRLAEVIGTRTFGKGIAQEIVPMENGGVVKVTVAKWYTPKGRNIERTGLAPDLYVDGNTQPIAMARRLLGERLTFVSRLTVGSLTASAGGEMQILDAPPTVRAGQLFVSLEGATQLFGVDAAISDSGDGATLRYGRDVLKLQAGTTRATLNGKPITELAPFLSNGVLMIPTRPLLDMTASTMTASGGTYTFASTSLGGA